MSITRRKLLYGSAAAGVATTALPALAKGKYDDGASDTEIKIGHSNPYSGPASAYGAIGKAIGAYFDKVNAEGGVNGRKIRFITEDDGYSPPKTVEVIRRLVEQEKVLLCFNTLGTPPNSAIHKYMNAKKVPQLFVATGASKWGKPKEFPWTMGWQPDYNTEGQIYAKHILSTLKDAKIAVLYQNDDYGKDYLEGFHTGLGAEGKKKIVMEASYEVTDPTVDSQILQLKNTGANAFFNITTPKFAAQAIKKSGEIGWKTAHYLNNVSASIASVIKPAGVENAQGIITAAYLKDPTDKQWENHKGYQDWLAWMKQYNSQGNLADTFNVFGYSTAQTMVQVLKQCGDELTRANVMKQAANLRNFELPMLLPGIKINTSPTDFYPIQSVQLQRVKGETWELFGDILSAESS
ncbi:MAG: ABC transporter substrate-binding protein [Reyranellaceae bacterium]